MLSAVFEIYQITSFHFEKYIIYLTYLGYFQSTFNPIIYTVFNKKFRRNFFEIITCKNKKSRLKRKYYPRY